MVPYGRFQKILRRDVQKSMLIISYISDFFSHFSQLIIGKNGARFYATNSENFRYCLKIEILAHFLRIPASMS